MTVFSRLLTASAFVIIGLTTPAAAELQCAKRDQAVEQLTQKFGEARQSIGLVPNSGVFEVYASKDTGSWTILVTNVHEMSCVVASGQAFETLAAIAAPAGDDA